MTGAIIVLYNPDESLLVMALKSLSVQVDEVCIVDNSKESHAALLVSFLNVHYIFLGENRGIAAAQNVGIRYLMQCGFDYVLFSDQDSIAPDRLVECLLRTYLALETKGFPVATIGPQAINRATGKEYTNKANIKRTYNKTELNLDYDIWEVYGIISSFSLTKLSNFNQIGLFEEALFIDGVDEEWCWRAEHMKGFLSYKVVGLFFSHFQGEGKTGRFLKKRSTPFRSYYQFRNFIILSKRPYTPAFWKWKNLGKFFVKFFYYPCCVAPRGAFLKAILRGCRDGILNRM